MVGAPETEQCAEARSLLDSACRRLGIPIAEHKRERPTTCLVFSGIEVDTATFQLRLPDDKLHRLRSRLAEWGDRKACPRKELESLLNHACKVVRSGRSFLRRMIDLLHSVPSHPLRPTPIRLNREFRSDLAWWDSFAGEWNGISFLPPPLQWEAVDMATDASGSWGCGAWYGTRWFQVKWDDRAAALPIAVKEMLPILLATAAWGPVWGNRLVHCHCDSQAVVACLRSCTSKQKHCMHMLRVLAFVEARHQFHLRPMYINTQVNHLADDLSRDNLSSFLLKVPQANKLPDAIPPPILDLLLDMEMDWVSPSWRRQFSGIFSQDWHPPHTNRTAQP